MSCAGGEEERDRLDHTLGVLLGRRRVVTEDGSTPSVLHSAQQSTHDTVSTGILLGVREAVVIDTDDSKDHKMSRTMCRNMFSWRSLAYRSLRHHQLCGFTTTITRFCRNTPTGSVRPGLPLGMSQFPSIVLNTGTGIDWRIMRMPHVQETNGARGVGTVINHGSTAPSNDVACPVNRGRVKGISENLTTGCNTWILRSNMGGGDLKGGCTSRMRREEPSIKPLGGARELLGVCQ